MSSPPPWDPYEVLGVSKDAEVEVIKKAHRKLVIKCHPDKIQDESLHQQAADEFHKVQRSYEILIDPTERRRYDNQMKLAELKAEQYSRGGGYSSAPNARPGPSSSTFEYRNGQRYEERVPDNASKFFEDDRYFDEPRARKFDGYERRHSDTRTPEKKTKEKVVEIKVGGLFAKARSHERENYSDRKKTRDKERRSAASDKYSRSAYVEDESDDSDDASYFSRREPEPQPRRRYEEPPKKSKTEPRRKETGRSRDDFTDEWEYKHVRDARDYIQRSKGSAPVEVDRRPTATRTSSARYYEAEPEPARRSSEKSRSGHVKEAMRPTSSGRERRPSIEIIEPSPKHETRKVPSMPTAKSSPSSLKIPVNGRNAPPPVHRSATTQYAHDNKREAPSIRRSETTPLTTSRHNDNIPSKSSKLRHAETHDSGYSSPGTPEMYQSSSPPKSTKYMIVEQDEEDFSRGHRTVLIDPNFSHSRRSTQSPSPPPRRSERPNLSTRGSSRPTPSRSNTSYAGFSPEPTPRPSMPRHESSRGASRPSPPISRHGSGRGDKLFGTDVREVDDAYKTRYSEDQVRYAKNYGPEDVHYGRYERRGSSSGTVRDTYPKQYMDRPPTLERGATFAY